MGFTLALASGSLARFELSAQARRRSEDLTPAASTTSERSAMLAHPSTELVARAPCQLRQSHARPVRAARARLRQQRRLEVDKTRKRDVQTGGPAGPSSRDAHAGTLPRPNAAPCWPIRRRSWSREHRASCGERMRDPSGPHARASASSAAFRSTSRASATLKRGAPRRRRREATFTLALYFAPHQARVYPLVLLMDSFRIRWLGGFHPLSAIP